MDDVVNKLITILEIVNNWLKYAEAKNAILLAFCGAGLTATRTYISASSNISDSVRTMFFIATTLLSFSSLVCSLSFLAKTQLEYVVWNRSRPNKNLKSLQKNTDNFYFFADLQKYTASELLDAINNFYLDNKLTTPYKKEYLDIAQQITVNSEIATLKFTIFNIALWILILSMIIIIIALIFSMTFSNGVVNGESAKSLI